MTTGIMIANLVMAGFTPEQIDRLIALRDRYDPLEHICTQQERQRLAFLKWQYSRELVTA